MSIAHRIAGLILFLLTPFLIYGLERGLRSPEEFFQIKVFFRTQPGKLILIMVIWAGAHHFFAGIRHLLLDLEIGFDAPMYRRSAIFVLGAGLITVFSAWFNL